jgi:hypothetical protein
VTDFWWGVVTTCGLSLLVAVTDRDSRRDLMGALWALLAVPLLIVSGLAMGLSRLVYHPRQRLRRESTRAARTAQARGVLISRRHRAVLVITDPKRKDRS